MGKPIYLLIKESILESIHEAEVNTPLPSEREYAQKYGASRMTVRKAIQLLVEEGYLYRDKNKGTFVADATMRVNQDTAVLLGEDDISYKIVYFAVKENIDMDIRTKLEMKNNDYALRVVRQAIKDNIVICIEEIYVPRQNITDKDLSNLKDIFDLKEYIQEGRMHQVFEAMMVPVQYAQLLNISLQTPIIRIDSLIRLKNGQPYALIKSYNNPKHKRIEITV